MGLLENLFNVGSGTAHKQKKVSKKKKGKDDLGVTGPATAATTGQVPGSVQGQDDRSATSGPSAQYANEKASSKTPATASTGPAVTGSILPASNKLEVNPALVQAKQRAAAEPTTERINDAAGESPVSRTLPSQRPIVNGHTHAGRGPVNASNGSRPREVSSEPDRPPVASSSTSATIMNGVQTSEPAEPPSKQGQTRFSKRTGTFAPAFFRRGSSLRDEESIRSVPSTLRTNDSSNVSSSEGTVKSILKPVSAFDKPKQSSPALGDNSKSAMKGRRGSQAVPNGYISYSKAERPNEKMPVRFDVDNLSELDTAPPLYIAKTADSSDDDDNDDESSRLSGSRKKRLSNIYEITAGVNEEDDDDDTERAEISGGEDGFMTANEEDSGNDEDEDEHFLDEQDDDDGGIYGKSTGKEKTTELVAESDVDSSDSTLGTGARANHSNGMDLDGWEDDESKARTKDVKARKKPNKKRGSSASLATSKREQQPAEGSFLMKSFALARRATSLANGSAENDQVIIVDGANGHGNGQTSASESSSASEEEDDAPGGWAAYQSREKHRIRENKELEKTANALAWEDEDVIADRSVLQSRANRSASVNKAKTLKKANSAENLKKRPNSESKTTAPAKKSGLRRSRRSDGGSENTLVNGNGKHRSSSDSDSAEDVIERTAAQTRKRKSVQSKRQSLSGSRTQPLKQGTILFPTGRDALDDDDEKYDRVEPLKAMQRPYTRGQGTGSIASDDPDRLAYEEEKSYFRILRNEPHRRRIRTTKRKIGSLTPEQTHYLKRALISMQMAREWGALGEVGALIQYGFPFRPTPYTVQPKGEGGEKAPILRALYQRFVYTFPNLKNASPEHFWQDRMQAFFDTFSSHNLSTTQDRGEVTKRRLLAMIATFFLSKLVNHAITFCGDDGVPWEEKPVALDGPDAKAVEQLKPPDMPRFVHGVRIYIPKVDLVRPRHGRSRQEYVVCTERATGGADIYVSRGIEAFKRLHAALVSSHPQIRVPAIGPAAGLKRLPHRLTLQGFLRELLHIPQLASSPHLIAFLGDAPLGPKIMTKDRRSRMQDLIDRDEHSLKTERRFWTEAAEEADRSSAAWRWLKDQLIYRDATLDRIHSIWKSTAKIDDWPLPWKKAEEFARVFVADFFHFVFVQSPMAAELFGILRAIYSFIPWSLFRAALKIANPSLMMKTAVGIFLNKSPLAGGKSLLQRLIAYIVNRDTKFLKREIGNLETSINEKLKDTNVCRLLKEYVSAPKHEQETIRSVARKRKMDIVAAILLHSRQLGAAQVSVIMEAHAAFEATRESYSASVKHVDEANPVVVEAMIYRNLKKLLRDYCRIRDREQVVKIVDESNTPLAIKSIVGVFYDPISEMSKASNLPDRIGDLQRFLEDMINTIQYSDRSANRFVELCERHEMSLYTFVRELWSSPKDIMDGLDVWFQIGLSFLKDGFSSSVGAKPGYQKYINMDAVLDRPEVAPYRRQILKEIDQIILHARKVKAVREVRRRNRYGQHIPPGTDDVLIIGPDEIGDFEGELSSLYLNTMVDSRDAKNLAADLENDRGEGGLAAEDVFDDADAEGNAESSDRYAAQLRMAQACRQFPERQAIGERKPVRGMKGPRLTAIPMMIPYFLDELNPVLGFEGGRKEPKSRQRRNSNESSSKTSRAGSVSSKLSGFFK